MRIAVTGADGFIGSHVCAALAGQNHEVLRVIRAGKPASGAHTIALDLSAAGGLEKLSAWKLDVVIHLAAAIPPSFEGKEAEQAGRLNRSIDDNVFAACEIMKTAVVYGSGASIYGQQQSEATESSRTLPMGPYLNAKRRGEEVGEAMALRAAVRFVALRINAPYGPGQRKRTVLRNFIERALKDEPLLYHGTGSREQDFTHVTDVAAAIVLAAESKKSGTFNIAGGRPVCMKDLAGIVKKCVPGSASSIGPSGQADPQEGMTARFSIRKAREELGWEPKVDLETGIRQWAKELSGVS